MQQRGHQPRQVHLPTPHIHLFIMTYDLGQPHFVITHNPDNQSRHSKSSSSAHCKPDSTLEPQRAFQAAVMAGEAVCKFLLLNVPQQSEDSKKRKKVANRTSKFISDLRSNSVRSCEYNVCLCRTARRTDRLHQICYKRNVTSRGGHNLIYLTGDYSQALRWEPC